MNSQVTKKPPIALRIAVGLLVVSLLLLPPLLTALVWTTLNLAIALVAVALVVAFSRSSRVRWWLASIAALLIAVPPYPYWVWANEQRGWHLHFFHGFTLRTAPIGTFTMLFVVALALFAVLFWVLPRPQQPANA